MEADVKNGPGTHHHYAGAISRPRAEEGAPRVQRPQLDHRAAPSCGNLRSPGNQKYTVHDNYMDRWAGQVGRVTDPGSRHRKFFGVRGREHEAEEVVGGANARHAMLKNVESKKW